MEDNEVHLHGNEKNERLHDIRNYIETMDQIIVARCGNEIIRMEARQIYYIESVDKRIFLYWGNGYGECDLRLYELEESLNKDYFVRVSKNCMVNIAHTKSIQVMVNRNLLLTMSNDEKVMVSRRYVKKFNEMIGME